MTSLLVFLRPGHGEETKAWAHGVLGMSALSCFAYNAGAWLLRRERHLVWNCVVYGGIVGFEIRQVLRHNGARSPRTRRLSVRATSPSFTGFTRERVGA